MGNPKPLNIQENARKIYVYFLKNTDHWCKKYRGDFTPTIRKEAHDLLECIITANKKRLLDSGGGSAESRAERIELQEKARIILAILNTDIDTAREINLISNDQLEYLSGLTYELNEGIKNWINSDLGRISSKNSDNKEKQDVIEELIS